MPPSKTSRTHVEVAERRRKLLELRKAGLTYQEVLDHHPDLGYKTTAEAAQDGTRALRAVLEEPAKDIVALEVGRLDALNQSLWAAARKGDVRAVDRVLAIMQRRARLLGLDYADRNTAVEDSKDARSMLADLAEQLARVTDTDEPTAADLTDLDPEPGPASTEPLPGGQ